MNSQFLSSAFALLQDSTKGLKSSPRQSADKRKPTTDSLRKSLFAAMLGAGSLFMAGTASATLIESIAALDEGAMYRVLFVTSATSDATSTDISDYNTFVSSVANSGSVTSSLGLTWTALASTASVNAQINTGIFNNDTGPVTMFNTFGEIVATSGSGLWSGGLNLLAKVNGDEDAGAALRTVWTGTGPDGLLSIHGALGQGMTVAGNTVASNWMAFAAYNFVNTFGVYGASSMQTKLSVDVPEPGTVLLLSLGLAGLSFVRYRKQPKY